MFIKTIFKGSKEVKRIRNYGSKRNLYLYFLMRLNLLISGEKMLMSAELKSCVMWFIYFLDLLQIKYNCAKFRHCRIRVQILGRGDLFAPPRSSVSSPERTILNRINADISSSCGMFGYNPTASRVHKIISQVTLVENGAYLEILYCPLYKILHLELMVVNDGLTTIRYYRSTWEIM